MQYLGKILGLAFAILFIISGVLGLLAFNVEQKAFSATTYKQAFENQRLYERMPAILATALTTSIAQNDSPVPFLRALTVEDWQNIISPLLPPEELKALADNALDSTFDYLNAKTNAATISVLPLKAHLIGEPGMNIIIQILHLQPPCTPEQLTQMALGLLGGQIVLCNPPDQALGLMTPLIQSQLQTMISVFPNEITFIAGTRSGTPDDPRVRLNLLRSAIQLSLFIIPLFLIGIAVCAVRSLKDLLSWWGWPIVITGVISALTAWFGSPLVSWVLRLIIQNQGAILIPPVLATSLAETATAVADQMLTPVVIEGIVLIFLGLPMVIIAALLGRHNQNQFLPGTNAR